MTERNSVGFMKKTSSVNGKSPVLMMYDVSFLDGWNAKTSGFTIAFYVSQKQSTTRLKS